MHMHMIKYLFDGSHYSKFKMDMKCKNLGIETQFISVPNHLILEIDKILENFQIKTKCYLNQNYIQSLFKEDKMELSEMVYKAQLGYNVNEVSITPKNIKKLAFLKNFFNYLVSFVFYCNISCF